MKLKHLPSARLGVFRRSAGNSGYFKLPRLIEKQIARSQGWQGARARKLAAIALPVAVLLVGGARFGHSNADPLPVCNESGSIYSNETWGTTCVHVVDSVEVTDGVTLTIDPGAIIKESGFSETGIEVDAGGTLDAAGDSGNHITFTSYKDDTAGGDTNGDGDSSSPAASNYESAILMNGGTADVSYADFEYGAFDIYYANSGGYPLNTGSDLTVADSSFSESQQGIAQAYNGTLSLERNTFALDTSGSTHNAVDVTAEPDLTGIVLSGMNKNTFSGSGLNLVVSADGDVPSDETWTVDSGSGAILKNNNDVITVDGTFTLNSGVQFVNNGGVTVNGTANLNDGDIIKEAGGSNAGFQVNSGGTLDAAGSSGSHITFTSYKDDTVGGDTNNNGDDNSPAAGDYGSAIAMNGGTADVSYADFEYAGAGIGFSNDGLGNPLNTGSDLTVTDSSFTESQQGISQASNGTLSLERNTFALDTSGSTRNAVVVTNDPDLSGIVLEGADKNTFSGSDENLVLCVTGDVPSDSTWSVDNSSGAVLFLNGASDSAAVTVDGTVYLSAGAIIKVGGEGFDVQSDGVLNAVGGTSESHSNPIVFTSYHDSTVGGGSNGDEESTGSEGNYTNAIRFEDPSSSDVISYAVFKYAGTAVSIGVLGTLSVDHSQSSNNGASFGADTTSTENP